MDLWHSFIGFCQYMFAPDGQPFYTGAFWSNQVQWTVVTLPTVLIALAHHNKKQTQQHEDLKQHITKTLGNK